MNTDIDNTLGILFYYVCTRGSARIFVRVLQELKLIFLFFTFF